MGIDTVIDYRCVPKEYLTTEGLLEKLKGRDRAHKIIKLYRDHGDYRPEHEIGFEMTRRASDGTEITELVLASSLLDAAAELDELGRHCADCPANRTGRPFGCVGYINYPISRQAEIWLLKRLPGPDHAVLFLLLEKGIADFGYTGEIARGLRDQAGVYFETLDTLARQFPELTVSTDQLFEMTFLLGPIKPGHAVMLLLFYNAIPRDGIDPPAVIALSGGSPDRTAMADEYPFLVTVDPDDDVSTRDLKAFLESLYIAYELNVALLLDV